MNKPEILTIFCFSQPLVHTEWWSLLGDKYCHSLPFQWKIVEDPNEAKVIAWDGVITPKGNSRVVQLRKLLGEGRILLLQGEARTALARHPLVELISLEGIKVVELPGWTVLPEELIHTLEQCFQKLADV